VTGNSVGRVPAEAPARRRRQRTGRSGRKVAEPGSPYSSAHGPLRKRLVSSHCVRSVGVELVSPSNGLSCSSPSPTAGPHRADIRHRPAAAGFRGIDIDAGRLIGFGAANRTARYLSPDARSNSSSSPPVRGRSAFFRIDDQRALAIGTWAGAANCSCPGLGAISERRIEVDVRCNLVARLSSSARLFLFRADAGRIDIRDGRRVEDLWARSR